MIISVPTDKSNRPETAINFKPQEVKFFEGSMSILALITSPVQSFCLAHLEPSARAPDGHRKADNFIPGQNMVAFDIDEGLTIEEAKEKLQNYVYIIYTTKSHLKAKNEITCERFRIILPTKTKFYVSVEQHKGLYENISKILEIPTYDVATRNVSRLWFTNPEADIIQHTNGTLFDVRCCIPETESAKHIIPRIENLEMDELAITEKRIVGMQKYTLINGVEGNSNSSLYRLGKFIQDLGEDAKQYVTETNAMLHNPLPEHELQTLIRSL